jgi:hypothetical protein
MVATYSSSSSMTMRTCGGGKTLATTDGGWRGLRGATGGDITSIYGGAAASIARLYGLVEAKPFGLLLLLGERSTRWSSCSFVTGSGA